MLKLREHQADVVGKINQGFVDGHRAQLLYAPTGFGKTEVAMYLMTEASKNRQKSAMMMDRIVLVNQTSQRLSQYKIPHGVMQADHWRYRPHEPIQICSAQTLEKRETFFETDLLIIDECHVQRKSVVKFIQDNPNMKVVGLTATPFTAGLGDVYTHVVGAKPTGELIDTGWLVKPKIFIAKEIDMTGAKKVAGEWSQDEVTERGMKITGDIVMEWINKTKEIFGKPVKTVVFCSGVAHGKDLERQFGEQGYNFKSISYLEEDEYKRETIEDFSQPDTEIHGLIATDILTRGFDVPDVMIGVSARPFSKSFSSHVQQMGRIMRPYPEKKFAVWLDHSGNYLRFRKDWDKLFDEGVTELVSGGESAKKELTPKEKTESKCGACGALWVVGTSQCVECGWERPMRGVTSVPGVLQELDPQARLKAQENQDFYSEMIGYARMRNYKEGWAAFKYKEKFGTFPKGLSTTPKTPSRKSLNWIQSRNIAWAKSKARSAV